MPFVAFVSRVPSATIFFAYVVIRRNFRQLTEVDPAGTPAVR